LLVRVAAFCEKALAQAGQTGIDLIIPLRKKLILQVKVYSTVAYHRCLRELHEYGYSDYRPSYAGGKDED